MGFGHPPEDSDVLRDAAEAAQLELMLAYEEIAQMVAAGVPFTPAQQTAAAQLLEVAAAARDLAAGVHDLGGRGGFRTTLAARAEQLVRRAAELREAFRPQTAR